MRIAPFGTAVPAVADHTHSCTAMAGLARIGWPTTWLTLAALTEPQGSPVSGHADAEGVAVADDAPPPPQAVSRDPLSRTRLTRRPRARRVAQEVPRVGQYVGAAVVLMTAATRAEPATDCMAICLRRRALAVRIRIERKVALSASMWSGFGFLAMEPGDLKGTADGHDA
jgi:hypothetical protein